MHFNSVFQVLSAAAIAITGVQAGTMSKENYQGKVSSDTLARLQQYRADHEGALNHGQTALLDFSENVVKNFATDELPAVEKLCRAAFDEAECRFILTGTDTSKAPRSLGRRLICQCAGNDDWCSVGKCIAGASHCTIQTGCGTLNTKDCDGLCG